MVRYRPGADVYSGLLSGCLARRSAHAEEYTLPIAYFVIELNGQVAVCAGAPNIQVLVASIIGTVHGQAVLGAHGMGEDEGQEVHLSWRSFLLSPRDQVTISYAAEGHATAPVSTSATPKMSLDEILASLESIHEMRPRVEAKAFSHTKAPRRHRLGIETAAGVSVDASLGSAEQLQAVVGFGGSGCTVEVDSLTVQPDGTTPGTRWLTDSLEPGQSITFTYGS